MSSVPDHLFRLIVDRTAVPFVVIDHGGLIHFASSSITELSGWRAEDLVGRNMVDFIDETQVDAALEGISEVGASVQADAGIPIVFALRNAWGGWTWIEVAAMPFFDHPELGLVALRLRSWEAQRHQSDFLHRLLADAPLAAVLESLTRSITASLYAQGAAVHHGWDGERFVGVAGSWDAAAALPLDVGPWVDAVGALEVVQVPADGHAATELGSTTCWLTAIGGGSVPPAVLSVWTTVPEAPLLGHRNVLAEAAGYVALALVRTAEHQRLLHLAGHDSLTGVANRGAFRERLAHALAMGQPELAVAFCDLDGFKQVNDEHGHGVGDDVLVQVAERLASTLRAGDELARMGGDEFTVLWRGVGGEADAERIADRLLATMDEPFAVPGGAMVLGISVGIALASPGATADSLLSAADAALYESKKRGGSRSTVRT
ncbi:MAG: putative Diguanylate kinase [Actinomycetia bacterium]|nr:putative Diguanylate kinase [Actinomycetes bacterium]